MPIHKSPIGPIAVHGFVSDDGLNPMVKRRRAVTDLIEIIKGRRSIRKYEDRDVPEEALKQILEAIRWAPSWTNRSVK